MKRTFHRSAFSLLLIILLPLGLQAQTQPLKVGIILPLSGNLAHLGESLQNGFALWRELHPAEAAQLQFLYEDDQFNPALSTQAAQKLINVNHVRVLMTVTSGPGNAVSPIAERAGVVHFCLTVDSRLARGPLNFVHLFQSRDGAKRLLEKARQAGYRRMGILHFIEDAAELSASELKRQAPDYGIEISYLETFPAGTPDFRSLITRVRKIPVDTTVIIALPPALDILARQMRDLKFEPPLTSIEIFSFSNEPRLFEGLWYVTPAYADPGYEERYSRRFGKPAVWAPYAEALGNFLSMARHNTRADGPAALAVALQQLREVATPFGLISPDSEGVFPVSAVISVMHNGKPALLER